MILLETEPESRISDREIAVLMRRLCQHLGIAFSANRVLPSLADLSHKGRSTSEVDQLNAIGTQFGIRFRSMTGSLRDLVHSVSDSGPVIVRPGSNSRRAEEGGTSPALVLDVRTRNQILVNQDGVDRKESTRWLRKNIQCESDQQYHWLLVQPNVGCRTRFKISISGRNSNGGYETTPQVVCIAEAGGLGYPYDSDLFDCYRVA